MPGDWVIGDVTKADQRPGLYANFTSQATEAIRGGISGVVACSVRSSWGPGATVQKISNIGDLTNLYTNVETSFPTFNAYFVVKNILRGGAKDVLVYRLLGPAAAKSTLALDDTLAANVFDVDGKYEGARGNNFTITIAAAPTDTNRKLVTLAESGTTLTTWTTRLDNAASGMVQDLVDQINEDTANYWITATFVAAGNETLANIAATNLTTGADDEGNIVAADYTEATDAFENEDFNILYLDTIDATFLATASSWITTVRNNGKKVILVTGSDSGDNVAAAKTDAEGFNKDGIVYVHPGYKANNESYVETTYHGYLAAARVAGIIAGQSLRQSPTYQILSNITDLVTRMGSTDVKSLMESGVMPLVYDGRNFKIERGINTLTTLATTQSADNKKIKITRTLDNINNSLVNAVADNIIGKVSNNATGRGNVVSLISGFLDTLSLEGVIDPAFTVEEDPDNPSVDDRFFVKIGVQPIDAIEFMYLTIEVS